jgi:hypothetical protein
MDMTGFAAGAPWGSAALEQLEFAVRPQAADAAIAALVTVCNSARSSDNESDFHGNHGYTGI